MSKMTQYFNASCQKLRIFIFLLILSSIGSLGVSADLSPENEITRHLANSTGTAKGDLYRDLGIFYEKQGEFEKSILCFEKAIEYWRDNPSLYYKVGDYYLTNDQLDKAERLFEKGLKNCPDDTGLLKKVIQVYFIQEKTVQIQRIFDSKNGNRIPDINLVQAKFYYYQLLQDTTSQIQLANSLIKAYPDNQIILDDVDQSMKELNQWDLAISVRKLLLQIEPDNDYRKLGLISALNKTGKFTEALEIENQLLESLDRSSEYAYDFWMERVRSYYGLNQWENAVDAYLNILGKIAVCDEPSLDASELMEIFQTNPGTLSSILQKKISLDPDNSDYYVLLIQAYRADDRNDAARQIIQKGIMKYPKEKYFAYQMAQDLIEQKKIDAAIAFYRQMTKDYPEETEPYYQIAFLYRDQKNYGMAMDCYESLLGKMNDKWEIFDSMVSLCKESGQWEKIDSLVDRYISVSEKDWLTYKNAAALYENPELREKAIPLYQKGMELVPKADWLIKDYLVCLKALHREDEVDKELKKLLQLTQPESQNFQQLGIFIDESLKRPQQALEFYKKATNMDSGNYHYWLSLARGYRHTGDIKKAEEIYRKIIKMTFGKDQQEIAQELLEMLKENYPVETVSVKTRWISKNYPQLGPILNQSTTLFMISNKS